MNERGQIFMAAVLADDFDAMVAIRIEALRESLERLGRFDPGCQPCGVLA